MTYGHNMERAQRLTLDAFFSNLRNYGIEPTGGGHTQGELLGIRLNSVFQPIFNLKDGEVIGHEALLRTRFLSRGTLSPATAFDVADDCNELVNFDRACRTVHMLNYIESAAEN